ncbi:unnamed protein product [Tenebrio molitor]|nr:unnamed protein product [Tenebrio molitor]
MRQLWIGKHPVKSISHKLTVKPANGRQLSTDTSCSLEKWRTTAKARRT